jgi:hypothetical protein
MLSPHTTMKQQSKYEAAGVKRNLDYRSSRRTSDLPSAPAKLHPARDLMICLGWLRLFRAIVSPSGRRPSTDET